MQQGESSVSAQSRPSCSLLFKLLIKLHRQPQKFVRARLISWDAAQKYASLQPCGQHMRSPRKTAPRAATSAALRQTSVQLNPRLQYTSSLPLQPALAACPCRWPLPPPQQSTESRRKQHRTLIVHQHVDADVCDLLIFWIAADCDLVAAWHAGRNGQVDPREAERLHPGWASIMPAVTHTT